MKSKIIDGYTTGYGYSHVTIQNKYGKFSGESSCNRDDMDNMSEFAGQRYAEIRAEISFAKHRLKQEKIKLKTIQDFAKDFTFDPTNINYEYYDRVFINNPVWNHVKKMEKVYSKNIQYWNDMIEILKNSIKILDKQRQDVLLRSNKTN